MQACDAQFADFIRSQVQTPITFCIVEQPYKDPNGTASGQKGNPTTFVPYNWQPVNQMVLDKITSVQISRTTDRTSDTCQFTMQDDSFQYASFRGDGNSKYGIAFQPGFVNNRFSIFLGFQGRNYADSEKGTGSTLTKWNYEVVQRFAGYLQTDDNPYQNFAVNKSVSLVDLTDQFQFDVYDSFPHVIYGNQNLPYFDPSYNLTNGSKDGVTWNCIGKMFTINTDSLVYGSTHLEPEIYIDFSCGQTPQKDYQKVPSGGSSTKDTTAFLWTVKDSGGNTLWTFDYTNGRVTFTNAWITARIADSGTNQIAKLTTNSNIGDTVFNVNRPNLFVVGGTVTLGMPTDSHQEQLTIKSIQSGANTITTTTAAAHAHTSGDPAMGNWVVSMAGNPTYMPPEQMIYQILVVKGNWDPSMLRLDPTHILINQYVGQNQAAWACLKEICDLTCPRFLPWMLYVDQTGKIIFEEVNVDAPYVKKFIDKRDLLTLDLSYSSQNISTVVRAEGECYTSEGAQSVTSLAFNMKAIDRYGQTQALLLDQHLTYNCRQMSVTQAVAYMNMLTSSVLGQVSEPILTLEAEIWPDPTLEINDKIRITDTGIGMDTDFTVTAINETVGPGAYGMKVTAQRIIKASNYMMGLPASVTYDNLLQPDTGELPSTSLIKEIMLGTGNNPRFVMKDWQLTQDPTTLDDMTGQWVIDGTAMHFEIFFDAKKPATNTNPYSYHNLPPGITWAPTLAPDGDTVYIATQPSPPVGTPANAGWTLYVGPDSIFYTYSHSGMIQEGDLGSFWLPPGNNHTPGQGQGTQDWYGYIWKWFYFCLDGNEGPGKFYRPIMRIRPSGQTIGGNNYVGDATRFHVPVGGCWQKYTWTNPPGPSIDGNSYYYGNLVIGISNLTPPPSGFVGAKVYGQGKGDASGGGGSNRKTSINWPDSNTPYYWGDKDQNGGPGWMAPGQTTVPVANASQLLPGDQVTIGQTGGGNFEGPMLIASVSNSAGTFTIDSSYNGGNGTKNPHYGGPLNQPDAPGVNGNPGANEDAPVIVQNTAGGMPDNLEYGVAYGTAIPQLDHYMNYQKVTQGYFCLFVMSDDGASQYVRIPIELRL